jgi:DNA-binding NarL/FixJ family response regulator
MINKQRRAGAERRGLPQSVKQKERSNIPSIQSKPPSPREALTPRERAVLVQIARGASSKEAGATLGVSSRTIEFHRANIMRKLGAKKIVDLMLLALRKNGD